MGDEKRSNIILSYLDNLRVEIDSVKPEEFDYAEPSEDIDSNEYCRGTASPEAKKIKVVMWRTHKRLDEIAHKLKFEMKMLSEDEVKSLSSEGMRLKEKFGILKEIFWEQLRLDIPEIHDSVYIGIRKNWKIVEISLENQRQVEVPIPMELLKMLQGNETN